MNSQDDFLPPNSFDYQSFQSFKHLFINQTTNFVTFCDLNSSLLLFADIYTTYPRLYLPDFLISDLTAILMSLLQFLISLLQLLISLRGKFLASSLNNLAGVSLEEGQWL